MDILKIKNSDGTWSDIPAIIGPQGPKGEDGKMSFNDLTPEQKAKLKGDKGDTGPQGPIGETGPQGPVGPIGPAFTYEDFTEEQLKGLVGPAGPTGETGPQGLQGLTGEAGPEGPEGKQGVPGKDGTNGKDGVSVTHSWEGSVLTITSASGTTSADLKGPQGLQGLPGEAGPQGLPGKDGADGLPGKDGKDGLKGDTGPAGETGPAGISAYQVAVNNGFSGSEQEWLASLKGEQGAAGAAGPKGETGLRGERGPQGNPGSTGEQGPKGNPGKDGVDGKDGKNGFTPTIQATEIASGVKIDITNASGTTSVKISNGAKGEQGVQGLQGIQGKQGEKGEPGETGPKGDIGETGAAGENGISAYQVAVNNGFIGDEKAWLASLKGEKGEPGKDGIQGKDGLPGAKGDTGPAGPTGEQGPKGNPGKDGLPGAKGDTGPAGEKGAKGDAGPAGKSAYQSAVSGGYGGTESAFNTKMATEYLPLTGGTLTGNLRLKNSSNYGMKLNFGDGDYAYIAEETDDKLTIKGTKIDLKTNNLTHNGNPLGGGKFKSGKINTSGNISLGFRPKALFLGTGEDIGDGRIHYGFFVGDGSQDDFIMCFLPENMGVSGLGFKGPKTYSNGFTIASGGYWDNHGGLYETLYMAWG